MCFFCLDKWLCISSPYVSYFLFMMSSLCNSSGLSLGQPIMVNRLAMVNVWLISYFLG